MSCKEDLWFLNVSSGWALMAPTWWEVSILWTLCEHFWPTVANSAAVPLIIVAWGQRCLCAGMKEKVVLSPEKHAWKRGRMHSCVVVVWWSWWCCWRQQDFSSWIGWEEVPALGRDWGSLSLCCTLQCDNRMQYHGRYTERLLLDMRKTKKF